MADVKISELTLAAAAGDSVVPASNAGGTATNKVTLQSVANLATPAAIGAVASDPTGITGADAIANMVSLTQAEYDALGSTDSSTLYVIQGQ
jgi:hypothetical protein